MSFIDNPCNDPDLRRGERLGRYGSAFPIVGVFCVIFSTDFIKYSASEYFAAALVPAFLGQVLVWLGMCSLRKCSGWESGITFYLWSGAFVTTIAVYGTVITLYGFRPFLPALIPWIAPVTATVAKRRMARARRV